jgi:uncharacterized lipoprotein YmbA
VKIHFAALFTFALLLLIGCSAGESETPQQAVQAIIDLHESRDFDTLVRSRYAEIGKAENDEQVQVLIDRFKARYEDESVLREAIAFYESALTSKLTLSADGAIATFELPGGAFKLSRMADGNWGFHL